MAVVASPTIESSAGELVDGGRVPPTPIGTARRRPRLLIADDDPVAQLVLSSSLELDFEVVGNAADSEEAIELARASQPDAALVDVVMPKGGGIRAVRGILEVAPRTAIVMLSAYKSKGTVRQLLQVGVFPYCRKGLEPRDLARTLNRSIAVHTAERRYSTWTAVSWHCAVLDRRSRLSRRRPRA